MIWRSWVQKPCDDAGNHDLRDVASIQLLALPHSVTPSGSFGGVRMRGFVLIWCFMGAVSWLDVGRVLMPAPRQSGALVDAIASYPVCVPGYAHNLALFRDQQPAKRPLGRSSLTPDQLILHSARRFTACCPKFRTTPARRHVRFEFGIKKTRLTFFPNREGKPLWMTIETAQSRLPATSKWPSLPQYQRALR
jgi:hypothetical protein